MDYFDKMPFKFTGTLGKVTVDISPTAPPNAKAVEDNKRKTAEMMTTRD